MKSIFTKNIEEYFYLNVFSGSVFSKNAFRRITYQIYIYIYLNIIGNFSNLQVIISNFSKLQVITSHFSKLKVILQFLQLFCTFCQNTWILFGCCFRKLFYVLDKKKHSKTRLAIVFYVLKFILRVFNLVVLDNNLKLFSLFSTLVHRRKKKHKKNHGRQKNKK